MVRREGNNSQIRSSSSSKEHQVDAGVTADELTSLLFDSAVAVDDWHPLSLQSDLMASVSGEE